MIDGKHEEHFERSLFGMPCTWVGIANADFVFLSCVLERYAPVRNIVELGTFRGVTALYLGMAMRVHDGHVLTIDHADHRPPEVRHAWLPNMTFGCTDLLHPDGPDASVCQSIAATDLLLVDNGNKLEEVSRYAGHLRRGALCLVHDVGTEAPLDALARLLPAHAWQEQMTAEGARMGAQFGLWQRVGL